MFCDFIAKSIFLTLYVAHLLVMIPHKAVPSEKVRNQAQAVQIQEAVAFLANILINLLGGLCTGIFSQ